MSLNIDVKTRYTIPGHFNAEGQYVDTVYLCFKHAIQEALRGTDIGTEVYDPVEEYRNPWRDEGEKDECQPCKQERGW